MTVQLSSLAKKQGNKDWLLPVGGCALELKIDILIKWGILAGVHGMELVLIVVDVNGRLAMNTKDSGPIIVHISVRRRRECFRSEVVWILFC